MNELPAIAVRHYRDDDGADLLKLFRETVRRVNVRDYSPSQVAAWASDEIDTAVWAARFQGRVALVAEWAGTIVGFADLQPDHPTAGAAYLDRFFVSADHQRMGIGRVLLVAIVAEAQSRLQSSIHLASSITAKPFFESQGFLTVRWQTVHVRGQDFVNYQMSREI